MSTYFTCKTRNDGIGAQACGIISIMVVAKAFGLTYVYTPLNYVAHYPYPNPNKTELKLWKMAWEQLLNFKYNNQLITQVPGTIMHINHRDIHTHFKISQKGKLNCDLQNGKIYSTREVHNVLTTYHDHPQLSHAWLDVLQQIRNGYSRPRDDTPHFTQQCVKPPKCIHIAIHVRRGDSTNNTRRFVNHSYFINVLDDITEYLKLHNRACSIQLYSEGVREDLPEFEKYPNLTYRLNDDHFDTLHHMICADVLVMSKSTFSYLPALFNTNGVIIYKPFWLLPPKPLEWIVPSETGKLHSEQLEMIMR